MGWEWGRVGRRRGRGMLGWRKQGGFFGFLLVVVLLVLSEGCRFVPRKNLPSCLK